MSGDLLYRRILKLFVRKDAGTGGAPLPLVFPAVRMPGGLIHTREDHIPKADIHTGRLDLIFCKRGDHQRMAEGRETVYWEEKPCRHSLFRWAFPESMASATWAGCFLPVRFCTVCAVNAQTCLNSTIPESVFPNHPARPHEGQAVACRG